MKPSHPTPLLSALAGVFLTSHLAATPAPADLRVGEGFIDPIGFHDPKPTL